MSDRSVCSSSFDDFKVDGEKVLNFLDEHFKSLQKGETDVFDATKHDPGFVASQIPEKIPEVGQSFDELMDTVKNVIWPGITNWQHPRFMGYYPSNTCAPAVLAELLIAGCGSVCLQWAASPSGTELEVRVMDWLAQAVGIGGPFLHTSGLGGGLIQGTAGEALANIFVCARIEKHRQLMVGEDKPFSSPEQREEAFYADSSKFVVYMSGETHFSGPKAARVAGMRVHQIKPKFMPDGQYRLSAEDLKVQIEKDVGLGLVPCCLELNYGTTNTCSIDMIEDFKELCEKYKIWVHVDAAYGGAAWFLPKYHSYTKKVEEIATSFNINGSKWLACGFDSAFLWVRDRKLLAQAFAATGNFMVKVGETSIYDTELKDWTVPLGRRFRSLRIWMVLSYFGVEGMRKHLASAIDKADWLRIQLSEHPELFQLPIKNELGLVVFKHTKGDQATDELCKRLQSQYFIFPSKFENQSIIRVAHGSILETQEDEENLFNLILKHATEIK